MNAPGLLTELAGRGVGLSVGPEGRLHCDAPKGVLTPELRAEIALLKAQLIALLVADAALPAAVADAVVALPAGGSSSPPMVCADCDAGDAPLFFELEGGIYLCARCWGR